MLQKLKQIYEEHYKLLLIIPFVMLGLALLQIGIQTATTGEFVNKGVSLSGGSTITIPTNSISASDLEFTLNSAFPNNELSVRSLGTTGLIVESTIQDSDTLNLLNQEITSQTNIPKEQLTTEVMGSALGQSFFRQTMIALCVAFILMGLVVFLYFRTPIPSLAVILAAGSDIIITLSIFNLTGMKLQTAGIAALLMLIGYSVDSDILVTTHMIKRRAQGSTLMRRIYNAMKTGITMSATTIVVLIVTLILVKSEVVKQIVLILLIGIIVDQFMTWIQNVGILRLYLESQGETITPTGAKVVSTKKAIKAKPIAPLKPKEELKVEAKAPEGSLQEATSQTQKEDETLAVVADLKEEQNTIQETKKDTTNAKAASNENKEGQ